MLETKIYRRLNSLLCANQSNCLPLIGRSFTSMFKTRESWSNLCYYTLRALRTIVHPP